MCINLNYPHIGLCARTSKFFYSKQIGCLLSKFVQTLCSAVCSIGRLSEPACRVCYHQPSLGPHTPHYACKDVPPQRRAAGDSIALGSCSGCCVTGRRISVLRVTFYMLLIGYDSKHPVQNFHLVVLVNGRLITQL